MNSHVAAGQRISYEDGKDVEIVGYNYTTEQLAESGVEVAEGKEYVVVVFNFYCTLSTDESCEEGLEFLNAVGTSGTVYERFAGDDEDAPSAWEVFGGGSKEQIAIVFEVDAADKDGLILFTLKEPRIYLSTGEIIELDSN